MSPPLLREWVHEATDALRYAGSEGSLVVRYSCFPTVRVIWRQCGTPRTLRWVGSTEATVPNCSSGQDWQCWPELPGLARLSREYSRRVQEARGCCSFGRAAGQVVSVDHSGFHLTPLVRQLFLPCGGWHLASPLPEGDASHKSPGATGGERKSPAFLVSTSCFLLANRECHLAGPASNPGTR
jgi:hypothetical protein